MHDLTSYKFAVGASIGLFKRYDTAQHSLISVYMFFKTIIKKLLFVCAILFVTICSSIANEITQQSSKRVVQEVDREFRGLADAIRILDIEAYFSYFDVEKFSGLNADGTHWASFDEMKAVVAPALNYIEEVESLVFPVVHLTVIDVNTVVLVNEYQQSALLKDGSRINVAGGGTQVWSKQAGQWKMVSVSASAKPAQANK